MRCGVTELKEIFVKSQSDLKALKQLEQELQHRQVPRAIELLAQVKSVMAAGVASSASTSAVPSVISVIKDKSRSSSSPRVADLFSSTEPAADGPASTQSGKHSSSLGNSGNTVHGLDAVATPKPNTTGKETGESLPRAVVAEETPHVSLSEAYKLLKATPTSPWESIELLRRELVQQSHPQLLKSMSADLREQSFQKARRVNAAYAVLSRDRYPKL
jgi:hypothetical protein